MEMCLPANLPQLAQATNFDSGSLLTLPANEVGHREGYKSKLPVCAFAPTIDTASTSPWLPLGSWYLLFYCDKQAAHTQTQLHPLYSSHIGPSGSPHLSCFQDSLQLPPPGTWTMYTWPLLIKYTHAFWLTNFLHCSRVGLNVTSLKTSSLMPTAKLSLLHSLRHLCSYWGFICAVSGPSLEARRTLVLLISTCPGTRPSLTHSICSIII